MADRSNYLFLAMILATTMKNYILMELGIAYLHQILHKYQVLVKRSYNSKGLIKYESVQNQKICYG